MPRSPAFQFYPRDLYADPAYVAMTNAERGAYLNLLCMAWLSRRPGIITEAEAKRFSGCTDAEWTVQRGALAQAFDLGKKPGFWVQRRMRKQWRDACAFHAQSMRGGKASRGSLSHDERSESARKAAQARWTKRVDADANDAKPMRSACEPDANTASASASAVDSSSDLLGVVAVNGGSSLVARRTRVRARSPAACDPDGFRLGILDEVAKKYPYLDVQLVRSKVLEAYHAGRVKSLNQAVWGYAEAAERRGIDQRAGAGAARWLAESGND
jgi:uncharacterized protein YdaU (DUF1376 family)